MTYDSLIVFNAAHDIAPDYIFKLISFKMATKYELSFNQKVLLKVQSGKMLLALGARACSYAAPQCKSFKLCSTFYR